VTFSVQIRKVDGVALVDMSGRLEIGETVQALIASVQSEIDAGTVKLVFNLKGLSYIDSSALGALVTLSTKIRGKHGDVRLLK
jgi:anti-anti-sigma factor